MTDTMREPKTYGGASDAPECPPEAEYVLMYLGVTEITWKAFTEGEEPKEQLVMAFKIDADNPQPGSLQAEWHHFDVRGWMTPILHYRPDLAGYTGMRYQEPNAYKLARALNGGVPLPMATETNPENGTVYFTSYSAQDAADHLYPLIGRRFRCIVGPSKSGWPRLKSDPMPMLAPTSGRRKSATEPTFAGAAASDASDPFAETEATT